MPFFCKRIDKTGMTLLTENYDPGLNILAVREFPG